MTLVGMDCQFKFRSLLRSRNELKPNKLKQQAVDFESSDEDGDVKAKVILELVHSLRCNPLENYQFIVFHNDAYMIYAHIICMNGSHDIYEWCALTEPFIQAQHAQNCTTEWIRSNPIVLHGMHPITAPCTAGTVQIKLCSISSSPLMSVMLQGSAPASNPWLLCTRVHWTL
jgi:hypothetical protein